MISSRAIGLLMRRIKKLGKGFCEWATTRIYAKSEEKPEVFFLTSRAFIFAAPTICISMARSLTEKSSRLTWGGAALFTVIHVCVELSLCAKNKKKTRKFNENQTKKDVRRSYHHLSTREIWYTLFVTHIQCLTLIERMINLACTNAETCEGKIYFATFFLLCFPLIFFFTRANAMKFSFFLWCCC